MRQVRIYHLVRRDLESRWVGDMGPAALDSSNCRLVVEGKGSRGLGLKGLGFGSRRALRVEYRGLKH